MQWGKSCRTIRPGSFGYRPISSTHWWPIPPPTSTNSVVLGFHPWISVSSGYCDSQVGAARPCVAMYRLKSLKFFGCWDNHVNASMSVFQASWWTVSCLSVILWYPLSSRNLGSIWNIGPTVSKLDFLVSKGWLYHVNRCFYSQGRQSY